MLLTLAGAALALSPVRAQDASASTPGAVTAPVRLPSSSPPSLPLPDLRRGVVLRVAYVHNPRFAPLPAERLGRVLALTRAHLRAHFGVEARFVAPVEIPILKVFAALPERLAERAERQRLDPVSGNAWALDRLARELLADLRREGDLPAQKRFAEPFLAEAPADDSDMAFARALVATQHLLLRQWQQLKGTDGQPLIGGDRYNEYTYWNLIGASDLPYEVLVTNQLIASAEWEDNSVHSAIRGGVSNGVTSESRFARFKLVSVLSTFPFLDDSPQTVRLRGGDIPAPGQADDYMALLLTHELGHQLLHLGHPFADTRCVMTPPIALRFRQWAQGLSATGCPLGANAANTPGAVKFAGPDVTFK